MILKNFRYTVKTCMLADLHVLFPGGLSLVSSIITKQKEWRTFSKDHDLENLSCHCFEKKYKQCNDISGFADIEVDIGQADKVTVGQLLTLPSMLERINHMIALSVVVERRTGLEQEQYSTIDYRRDAGRLHTFSKVMVSPVETAFYAECLGKQKRYAQEKVITLVNLVLPVADQLGKELRVLMSEYVENKVAAVRNSRAARLMSLTADASPLSKELESGWNNILSWRAVFLVENLG